MIQRKDALLIDASTSFSQRPESSLMELKKIATQYKWPILSVISLIILLIITLILVNVTEVGHKQFVESGFFNKYTLFVFLTFALLVIILLSVSLVKNTRSAARNANDALEAEKTAERQKRIIVNALKRVGQTLRSSPAAFWRNTSYNYKLPWFLICGPEQAGKTAFLRASGLRLPSASNEGRNIDLDFNSRIVIADQAVFIDSAGPFCPPEQKPIWEFFISKLRRFRPTQPLNGLILLLDIDVIMQGTHARMNSLGLEIRDHLSELQNSISVTPPIYLVFTKLDTVTGFKSFFKGSPAIPTKQVFGLTLPLQKDEGDQNTQYSPVVIDHLSKEFDDLVQWQLPRMLERLNQEIMPKNRYEAFVFLTEFMKLKKNIVYLIEKTFAPNELDDSLHLRGVYFVNSLTFETQSQSAKASSTDEIKILEPVDGLFINDLIEKLIFSESGLVGFNEQAKRFINRLRAVFQTGAASFLIFTLTWLLISFSNNNQLLNSFIHAVGDAGYQLAGYIKKASERSTVTQISWTMPFLEAVQDIPAGWNDTTIRTPFPEKAGLSQRSRLNNAAVEVYVSSLRKILLPRIFDMLEQNLSNSDLSQRDLYENLMVYLMFCGVHPVDYKISYEVIEKDFKQKYSTPDYRQLRQQFSGHLHNLLEVTFEPQSKDIEIIQLVRNRLKDFSPAMRGFDVLLGRQEIKELPSWRTQDALGPLATKAIKTRSGGSLFVYVPGMYTTQGLTTVVLPLIPTVADIVAKEDWVLFNSTEKTIQKSSKDRLKAEITELYVKNYIETWDRLISDLDFISFANFKQEISLIQSVLGPPSPLEGFLTAVSQETSFNMEQNKNSSKDDQGSSKNDSKPAEQNEKKTKNYINDHFAQLHSFTNGTPSSLSDMLKSLGQIKSMIGPIAVSNSALSPETGKLAANTSLGQNLDQLESIAIKAPPSVETAIGTLIRQTTILLETVTKEDVETDWKENIYKYCQRSINNHYPFSFSKNETTLNDFIKMFATDGLMDQFFEKYIKTYVDTSTTPWGLLANTDSKLEFSPSAIHYFEQASWIKKVFFPGGSKDPRISFGVMPTDLDIKAKGVTLDIGGQSLAYQYGAQQMQTVLWPNGANGVRINFANTDINQTKALSIEGPWALFRLMQSQKFEKLGPTRFSLDINFSGRYASFILEAATVDNPFQKDLLRGFKCPPSLIEH